jgi:hypothetical protein
MSYSFDVRHVWDAHIKNAVDKTHQRTTFVISASNNVLHLFSKLTELSKTVSAITPPHWLMQLSVVFFFYLLFSYFSN